jgi:uncharacterized protein (TIGR02145 family)
MKIRNSSLFVVISLFFLILSGCSKNEDTPDHDEENPDLGIITGTFIDSRDQKVYNWVKLGTQTWMAENLSYKPNNGDFIAHEKNEANIDIYGYLYGWDTAQNVAPSGWRLPTESEWMRLVNFLGGTNVAGGKMKETGTTHWDESNMGADNSSGFTALPGGMYSPNFDRFVTLGRSACWWSSSDNYGDNNDAAFYLVIYVDNVNSTRGAIGKSQYLSVRCIKDEN